MLYAEQSQTREYEFVITPVEVETTQMGMDFESLRSAIQQSYQQIEPYNQVSFRVLHQMANLLEQQAPEGSYEPLALNMNDQEQIIEAYRQNLENKKIYERKFWEPSA